MSPGCAGCQPTSSRVSALETGLSAARKRARKPRCSLAFRHGAAADAADARSCAERHQRTDKPDLCALADDWRGAFGRKERLIFAIPSALDWPLGCAQISRLRRSSSASRAADYESSPLLYARVCSRRLKLLMLTSRYDRATPLAPGERSRP